MPETISAAAQATSSRLVSLRLLYRGTGVLHGSSLVAVEKGLAGRSCPALEDLADIGVEPSFNASSAGLELGADCLSGDVQRVVAMLPAAIEQLAPTADWEAATNLARRAHLDWRREPPGPRVAAICRLLRSPHADPFGQPLSDAAAPDAGSARDALDRLLSKPPQVIASDATCGNLPSTTTTTWAPVVRPARPLPDGWLAIGMATPSPVDALILARALHRHLDRRFRRSGLAYAAAAWACAGCVLGLLKIDRGDSGWRHLAAIVDQLGAAPDREWRAAARAARGQYAVAAATANGRADLVAESARLRGSTDGIAATLNLLEDAEAATRSSTISAARSAGWRVSSV